MNRTKLIHELWKELIHRRIPAEMFTWHVACTLPNTNCWVKFEFIDSSISDEFLFVGVYVVDKECRTAMNNTVSGGNVMSVRWYGDEYSVEKAVGYVKKLMDEET
jgi:hypothetical protein